MIGDIHADFFSLQVTRSRRYLPSISSASWPHLGEIRDLGESSRRIISANNLGDISQLETKALLELIGANGYPRQYSYAKMVIEGVHKFCDGSEARSLGEYLGDWSPSAIYLGDLGAVRFEVLRGVAS